MNDFGASFMSADGNLIDRNSRLLGCPVENTVQWVKEFDFTSNRTGAYMLQLYNLTHPTDATLVMPFATVELEEPFVASGTILSDGRLSLPQNTSVNDGAQLDLYDFHLQTGLVPVQGYMYFNPMNWTTNTHWKGRLVVTGYFIKT